MFSGTIKGQ